jgi:hypothetical protein
MGCRRAGVSSGEAVVSVDREPDQVTYFVEWVERQAATDPSFLERIRRQVSASEFTEATRERIERELDALEDRTQR